MMSDTEMAQATAARTAGAMYLFVMAAAVFGESFVRSSLIVWGDAAQTAENILRSERLFRVSIVTDLAFVAAIIVLSWALWVLLRPVNRNLALLGALFRLAEAATLFAATLASVVALTFLSGADYLNTLDAGQRQSLALVAVGAQGHGMNLSFVPAGLGSALFAYLLARSRYVPKVLAVWGVLASVLWTMSTFAIYVFPALARYQSAMMIPMAFYEIPLGFWLLLRGARIRPTSPAVS